MSDNLSIFANILRLLDVDGLNELKVGLQQCAATQVSERMKGGCNAISCLE